MELPAARFRNPSSPNGETGPETAEPPDADRSAADDRRANEAVVAAYALLMTAHCRRVYRVVRSILRDPAEIEDVMQQTYVATFARVDSSDTVRDSTWLCRMALNEALSRIRQRGRFVSLDTAGHVSPTPDMKPLQGADVAAQTANLDIVRVFEDVVDGLSEVYRTVLIMRDVEGMAVAETAAVLNVDAETVKLRLHQARSLVKRIVRGYGMDVFQSAFSLHEEFCARVLADVTAALRWTLHLSDPRQTSTNPTASSTGRTARPGRA